MRKAVLIALLIALASPVAAQEAVNGTTDAVDDAVDGSALDALLEGVEKVGQGIGDAAQATGEGIQKGAGAVGRGFIAAVAALGSLAMASLTAVAQSGATVSEGLADAAIAAAASLGAVGAAMTALVVVAGRAIAFVSTAVWDGLLVAIGAYWGLVKTLRPEAMSTVVFGTVTAVGAAGSAGAGGWAGMQALKKWGMLGTGLGGVAGFSRINDADLLEHPLRGQIFDVIKSNPGIHASQLARELDVGWGTITHHLDKLQRGKLVATRKVNNQKCFFEQGGEISRADMAIASALKGDTASGIAEFVASHPMTSQKSLAEALDISPALASFHVKKLVNLGVLEKFRHGKETLLTTSDGLRRVMASTDPAVSAALQKDEAGFEYGS